MTNVSNEHDPGDWFGTRIEPGQTAPAAVPISQAFDGSEVRLPIRVTCSEAPGPTVAVTAAVHGDELNGTGAIRRIMRDTPFELNAGTLVLVPVVNLQGFERHTRYLPDRRDLNRCFPGSAEGSYAARLAHAFFERVIKRCDWCIDLHTAAVRRTNFPNVRADMSRPELAAFARAFGAEFVVSGRGPVGSLRRAACEAGVPTIILEAGEVWKVEPGVVDYAVRGITNCLRYLGMVSGKPAEPEFRLETDATKWIRAERGGFLEFHVAPGDILAEGDAIATNADLTGVVSNVIRAPRAGVVIGMTTIPSVAPGDPVCHLAFSKSGVLNRMERTVDALEDDALYSRLRDELATSLRVTPSV
ncbi:MAG: succinylglutamate desuccinylase/aspartoacylase family protein [Planctomycetota bacterium]